MKETDSKKPRSLTFAVCISWAAHLILVVSGFIVPRLIDQGLGGAVLGTWDLAWAMVNYLKFIEGGIGSSVNRHVALHQEKDDLEALNRTISSVSMIQRGMATVMALAAIILAVLVPYMIGGTVVDKGTLRWLILLLGGQAAVMTAGAVYGGILTGCHRWGLHQGIGIFINILILVGLVGVLLLGWGLVALAAVYFVCQVLDRILRSIFAYRICPGLSVRLALFDGPTAKSMVRFGGKMFLSNLSRGVMMQTTSVMIAASLGPATLALFARSRSLVNHVANFQQKYAYTLVPSGACLGADRENVQELRQFAISTVRTGLYVVLPMLILLALCGGGVLELWMGKAYAAPSLIAILALGFTAEIAHQPLNQVLFSLDRFGKPAIANIVGAIVATLSVGAVLLGGQRDLKLIALAMVVPWTLIQGFYLPFYACRSLGISIATFIREAWLPPLVCSLPFTGALLLSKQLFPDSLLNALFSGIALGGVVLLACYWIWVLPRRWKEKALNLVRLKSASV